MDNEVYSNNIVAQSDYEVAMKAIESTFAEFQTKHQETNENDGLDQDRVAEIYETAKLSLMEHLQRITQPIADDDFHDYIDQHHFVPEDDEESEVEVTATLPEADEEQEEIDDEELIDKGSWQNALTLRERIRTMSQTVQAVRERILTQSREKVSASVLPCLAEQSLIIEDELGDDSEDDCSQDLRTSLETLSRILRDPEWSKLPHHIQTLQETIDAVQKETSVDRTISQTEAAILSKNNENDRTFLELSRKLLDDSDESGETGSVTPLDRIALLGLCV